MLRQISIWSIKTTFWNIYICLMENKPFFRIVGAVGLRVAQLNLHFTRPDYECIKGGLKSLLKDGLVEGVQGVIWCCTQLPLALQQRYNTALPSPPSPASSWTQRGRGEEAWITSLSRNWSMFNSSSELTGTSTKCHLALPVLPPPPPS